MLIVLAFNVVGFAESYSAGVRLLIAADSASVGGSRCGPENVDRAPILTVLEKSEWKIEGPDGVAFILNLKPNTLCARVVS